MKRKRETKKKERLCQEKRLENCFSFLFCTPFVCLSVCFHITTASYIINALRLRQTFQNFPLFFFSLLLIFTRPGDDLLRTFGPRLHYSFRISPCTRHIGIKILTSLSCRNFCGSARLIGKLLYCQHCRVIKSASALFAFYSPSKTFAGFSCCWQ